MSNPYSSYLSKIRASESSGNDKAHNPHGASGRYQFLPSTWKNMGYNIKDIYNPQLQEEAVLRLTTDNANYLKKRLGINPTDTDLYGAHFLGQAGYTHLYQTADNAPISSVMSRLEIAHNPFVQGKTVGFVKNWLAKKMSVKPSAFEGNGNEYGYGVDTSLNLPMNTGEYQTAPDIASKEDLEAEQAKAELIQKQKEKDFLAEVQARQDQDTERRYQQEQESQQQQEDNGIDPSYYQVPNIELPNYQAIQYEQAQAQAPQQQYRDGGGIPERYKNMGFNHVGQKKDGDGQHKWKVLAKKGDKYKVVQGGYRGMQDFSQHHSKKRQDNFWSRMGGKDSAKANDPFSPLYWHKRLGKWEDGGEMKGKVKCSNCGWEWDKSDSMEEDMYNCHKCGGQNTGKDMMKNGGQIMTKFEVGGESSEFDNNSARDWWVKQTGKTWAEAKQLGYTDGSRQSNIELLDQLRNKDFKIENNNQKPSPKSGMKQFNGFSQEAKNYMQTPQPPVTKRTIQAPLAKAKKEIKEVDQMSLFEKVMRGDFLPQGNERRLQNGVITDKRTNTSYIIENGEVKKSFPVLTGANPDMNINDKGVDYLETHPKSKATPRGTYVMDPKNDIYGQPGFSLNPVAAFGEAAPRAKDIAQHVTYPGEFKQRNPLYAQEANKRYASYGCINCRKPDINYITDRFKKGDTTMVIDSKIKRDADFLAKKLFTRK